MAANDYSTSHKDVNVYAHMYAHVCTRSTPIPVPVARQ